MGTFPKMRLPLISESTRACLREAWRTPGFGLLDTLHGYLYGRYPYTYIGVGIGTHPAVRRMRPVANLLFNALNKFPADNVRIDPSGPRPGRRQRRFFNRPEVFADTYHGKVVRLAAAKQLVTVGRALRLAGLERVLPFRLARDLILQRPDRIVALECPCRSARAEPCRPLEVCLIVGEPFAGFVEEHHAGRCRAVSTDEACAILEAEAGRGHVHHAFFKEAALGRFFAICNCCACCCGAMEAHRNGIRMLAASGWAAVVDEKACEACGACAAHCPFGAAAAGDGPARVDRERCMGCGVCTTVCPEGAIALEPDPRGGEPLELDRLLAAIAGD